MFCIKRLSSDTSEQINYLNRFLTRNCRWNNEINKITRFNNWRYSQEIIPIEGDKYCKKNTVRKNSGASVRSCLLSGTPA